MLVNPLPPKKALRATKPIECLCYESSVCEDRCEPSRNDKPVLPIEEDSSGWDSRRIVILAFILPLLLSCSPATVRSKEAVLNQHGDFRQAFSVLDYGAAGDGVADDTAEIQAAIDAAEAAGGGVVYIPHGIYRISSSLINDGHKVRIVGTGIGQTIIKPVGTASPFNAFNFRGKGLGSALGPLTTDFTKGDKVADLTNASGLAVGDLLYFDSTVSVPPGQNSSISMITEVSNISTLAITVGSPSPILIQTSETHTVKEWTPLYAPGLSNLTIDLGMATGAVRRGVLVQDVRDGVFEDVEIVNSSEAGFYSVRGYRNHYREIKLRNSGSGNESDFTASFETLSHFNDIQSINATGFGPQWIACSYCFGSGVMSAGATGRGIKLHGVLQSNFANLAGLNSASTGIAITLRTQYNNFTNLVAMGNASNSGNDIGLWFSGQENIGNYCAGVKVTINGDYDIQINSTDTHNVIVDAYFDSLAKISNSGGSTNFVIGSPARTGF